MRIIQAQDIVSVGRFPASAMWKRAMGDIEAAIATVDWPHGKGTFSLNPTPVRTRAGKLSQNCNGVAPIKLPMIAHLERSGWQREVMPPAQPGQLLRKRDLDAMLEHRGKYVAFEWETGNVSSSHRAISKLLDALCRGVIAGGALVVPVRETGRYLTERIGNWEELEPYFKFWSRYPVADGALRIYGIRHDELDTSVEHIPKKTDGRANG
jgi:Restriction endonuclease BamHI